MNYKLCNMYLSYCKRYPEREPCNLATLNQTECYSLDFADLSPSLAFSGRRVRHGARPGQHGEGHVREAAHRAALPARGGGRGRRRHLWVALALPGPAAQAGRRRPPRLRPQRQLRQ